LIELLVVISLISVLLAGVGVTLHILARLNQQLRADLPGAELLGRLSVSFRRDAHEATAWSLDRENAKSPLPPRSAQNRPASDQPASAAYSLRLQRSDQKEVVYQNRGLMIVREEFRDGERTHRETFRFPRASVITWELTDKPVNIVTLRIEQPQGRIAGAKDSLRMIRIAAALDLDGKVR
jgi:hypothetical protein